MGYKDQPLPGSGRTVSPTSEPSVQPGHPGSAQVPRSVAQASLISPRSRKREPMQSPMRNTADAHSPLRIPSAEQDVLSSFAASTQRNRSLGKLPVLQSLHGAAGSSGLSGGAQGSGRLTAGGGAAVLGGMSSPYISLDKQCLTCSGQTSIVLSAFKIACLTYQPSPLHYRGNTFSRQGLIALRGKMLNAMWDQACAETPWGKGEAD